ncbi:hypothetical protein [Longimicrobium sp.]|jgi:plasmid maintenance system antidote protein VapI|uniref:hypothetical protein n=1 Tax=Longimicrobium sp. TaxID=2029185 RepID=UPI002F930633
MKAEEVFPVAEFVRDEMAARGWGECDLIHRLGADAHAAWLAALILNPMPGVLVDDDTAARLACAFGTSAALWLRLDAQWQAANPSASPVDAVPSKHGEAA